MKKCIKNAVCASMTLLLLGSGLVGCSKTGKGDVKKVEDDGKPFYDSELIYLEEPKIEGAEDAQFYGSLPVKIDGKYYQNLNYYVQEKDSYKEGALLITYDENGKITEQKDLKKSDAFKNIKGDFGFNSSSSIILDGKCLVSSYDYNSGAAKTYIYDFAKDTLEEFTMVEMADNGYIGGLCQLSDGTYVVQYSSYSDNGQEMNKVYFGDEKKAKTEVDLMDKFKDLELMYVGDMMITADGFKLIGYSETKEYEILYDEKSGEFTARESETEMYNIVWSTLIDGKLYNCDNKGIYLDGQEEPIINFEDGNIAPDRATNATLVEVNDNGAEFLGTEYMRNKDRSYILRITKYDKNPNVGKELLTLSSLTWIDTSLEDAIVKFNKESDKYYIKILMNKYTLDYQALYDDVDSNSMELANEINKKYNETQAELVNQLAMDLLAGDAPDIMIGCSQYSQLMKDTYLLDLKKFIEKDLGSDNFYQNIIEGATYDGKVFVVPLTFHVMGIMAKPDDVKGKVGFTYDEYVDFVKGPCNGSDPFNRYGMTRISVLQELFSNEAELFIKDGKIDVDNDDFHALAEFVKDNCEDPVDNGDDIYYETSMGDTDPQYVYLNGFDSYIRSATGYGSWTEPYALCGVPSADGRGAIVSFDIDISISAQSGSSDGAKEFIKSITASDSLYGISANSYSEAINKDTTRSISKDSLKDINNMMSYGPKPKEYGEEDIEDYIKVIETCRVRPACDPAILNIIAEEIPAYFAGQKDISEVCKSINNRAQTVLDEKS